MDARTRYVADRIAQKFSLHDKVVVEKFVSHVSVAEVLSDFFSANGRPSLVVYFQAPQKGERSRTVPTSLTSPCLNPPLRPDPPCSSA